MTHRPPFGDEADYIYQKACLVHCILEYLLEVDNILEWLVLTPILLSTLLTFCWKAICTLFFKISHTVTVSICEVTAVVMYTF